MKSKLILMCSVLFLALACNKIKDAPFQQGDYVGSFKVYENDNVVSSSGYELDFEKNRYDGESISSNVHDESVGNYSVNGDVITFINDYDDNSTTNSVYLQGQYFFDYYKKGKKLHFYKVVGSKKYEYYLVRKKS